MFSGLKAKRLLAVLQLLTCEIGVLFTAGVVIPSVLRSFMPGNHAEAPGALHHFTIAHVTFLYKFQNLGFAIAGVLFGAAIAYALRFPSTVSGEGASAQFLRFMQWKHLLFRKKSWARSSWKAA